MPDKKTDILKIKRQKGWYSAIQWLLFGTMALLLAGLPAVAQKAHKAKSKVMSVETATINNTGSTNTAGYQIMVRSNGAASYRVRIGKNYAAAPTSGKLTQAQAAKFFHDLAAARPLSHLPAGHGLRSVSFGTTTYVTYHGQSSPDLMFPGDARAKALHDDIAAITQALHVSNTPRRPLLRPRTP